MVVDTAIVKALQSPAFQEMVEQDVHKFVH